MTRGSAIALATALLGLGACQGGNEQAAANAVGNEAAPSGGGGAAASGLQLQPGQWETRVEVVRVSGANLPPGMAAPQMPPVTASYCITPEQAADPSASMMAGNQMPEGCTTEDYTVSGGRIAGTVQCNIQGNVSRTTMSGRFTPTSYEMTMQAQQNVAGVEMESETRVTARRTGDCPAG